MTEKTHTISDMLNITIKELKHKYQINQIESGRLACFERNKDMAITFNDVKVLSQLLIKDTTFIKNLCH